MTLRLKHLIQLQYGDALASDARQTGEFLVYGSNGPVGEHNERNMLAPAIVIGRKGSFGKVTWAEDGGFCIDTAFYCDRRYARGDLRYIFYLLQSLGLDTFSKDSAVPGLDRTDALNKYIPEVHFDLQKVLVAFLDLETSRIDQLIAKKKRIAGLISAKWEALIDEARQTKDAKWVRFGAVVVRAQRPIGTTNDKSFIPLGLYNRGRGFFKKTKTDDEDLGDSDFFWVREGDIVFSGQFAWEGAIGHVNDNEDGCVVSHRYPVYRAKEGIEGAYLYAFFRTAHGAFLMDNCSRGAAGRNRPLNTWSLERELVLIPSDAIQKKIARLVTLEHKTRRLVKEYVRKALELRSALISAAVNGQLDIREKLFAQVSKPDRANFRLIVSAEIIHQHLNNPKFGRVKLQKELYLAESHIGINELQGNYLREAAGPFDRSLLDETEKALEAAKYYCKSQPDGTGTHVAYIALPKAGQHTIDLRDFLGSRADDLRKLINLLRDLDTESVEAVATLYAVWNDSLIDGQRLDDAAIINNVLTEWHTEKKQKFRKSDLETWLAWMKRHNLTPRGKGPRTTHTMTRDMFA